jgi:hypothetical protein
MNLLKIKDLGFDFFDFKSVFSHVGLGSIETPTLRPSTTQVSLSM